MITERKVKSDDCADIYIYELTNSTGLKIELTNYGASIFRIIMKDKNGQEDDILLTCDSIKEFMNNKVFFGATIGRVSNRIKDATFSMNGKKQKLSINDKANHLHGGIKGFDKQIWHGEIIDSKIVKFTYLSPNGEEGYMGNLEVSVSYHLGEDGLLSIIYEGCADEDTVLNMTNHSYFNLRGHKSGKIYDQFLCIESDFYLEATNDLITTGQICSVKNTPHDFRIEKKLNETLKPLNKKLEEIRGHDLTYVKRERGYGLAATVFDEKSGRKLEVFTDYPAIHLYTGNFVDNEKGRNGAVYNSHESICLEAQRFPNAMNYSHFGDIFLLKNDRYSQEIGFKLTIMN